jgi:phosphate transport system substrate-binding protein
MRSSDDSGRESVAELSRRLLERSFPDKPAWWIAEQTELAEQRVRESRPPAASTRSAGWFVRFAADLVKRGVKVRFWVLIAIAGLIAITVVTVVQPVSFAQAFLGTGGIIGLAVAAMVALAVTVVTLVRTRRAPLLSCRVRIDTPWNSDVGGLVQLRRPDSTIIESPGVVVARIKNLGGSAIERDDYRTSLTLRFPGREVVTVDVTDSDPVDLQDKVPYDPGFSMGPDRITLPKVPLKPNESFKLMVVLSGTRTSEEHRAVIDGLLWKGAITTQESPRRIRRTTILWAALTFVVSGALAVILLLNSALPFLKQPADLDCVPGTLTVEGSSSFGPLAMKSAVSYEGYCPGATVQILTPGSLIGLRDLNNSTSEKRQQLLALSDGKADSRAYPDLLSRPVAVVPYTFVVNDSAPVNSLTMAQVRAIFTGQATRWSDITGNPRNTEPIRVVGRTNTSGTRNTLETHVLGTPEGPVSQAPATSDSCRDLRSDAPRNATIMCEQDTTQDLVNKVESVDYSIGYADTPDASNAPGVRQVPVDGRSGTLAGIQAGYPFWTVEYVYSEGALPSNSLAVAFIKYLSSSDAAAPSARFQYVPCLSGNAETERLCRSGR